MTRAKRGSAVVLGAIAALVAGLAWATPPSGFTPELLARGTIGKLDAQHQGVEIESRHSADIAHLRATFEPKGSTGWHHHPGVALITVKSGAVTLYRPDCSKHTYRAGETFVEVGNDPSLARNNSATKKAVVFPTFVVPTSTPEDGLIIDDQQPEGCDVK